MAIPVETNGRFATLRLTVDRLENVGEQVIVAQAAGYSWKQICAAFGKGKSTLNEAANKARDRLLTARAKG